MRKVISKIIGFILIALMIGLDQWTKLLAVDHLKGHEPFSIINGVFVLQYLENRGAAFGMLQGKKVLFVIMTIVVVTGLIIFYIRLPHTKKYFLARMTCVLLISGALGNFIDRVAQSYVVDFFYFVLIDFPIFNVADIYVTFACIFLVIGILFVYKENDFEEVLIKHE